MQQQAAVALANIAHQRQRQYARQAVEAGACEALVAALVAHPANTKVLLACCAALAQLAAGGAACVDAVAANANPNPDPNPDPDPDPDPNPNPNQVSDTPTAQLVPLLLDTHGKKSQAGEI